MVSTELAAFLEGPRLHMVATRDRHLAPSLMHAWGVRVAADGLTVTVFLAAGASERLLSDLRENGEIALTSCELGVLRTYQIKGRFRAVRPPTDDEVRSCSEAFAGLKVIVEMGGTPRAVLDRVALPPCHAIEFEVRHVFEQTPGRGAGARL